MTRLGIHDDNGEANARLIAAAHDLLTNLRHLVGLYHAKVAPSPQTIEEASAAIAKAEGEIGNE